MINLSSLDIADKNLVIRVDMNVPLKDSEVLDATRIKACLPSIKHALSNNARILLISHLGRPSEGNFEEKFSLQPVAEYISNLFNEKCELINSLESKDIFNGKFNVQLLENIRFFEGEKSNSAKLGKILASLGDIYVFDAFGTAHREQASTHSAIEQANIACAGFLLERENRNLTKVLNNYENPYIAVIGGAKVSTKLEPKVDNLILGGGMCFTFLKSQGYEIGASLCEDEFLNTASKLLQSSDGKKIILPVDFGVSNDILSSSRVDKPLELIESTDIGVDIGSKSVALFNEIIHTSNTIFWNGPMGVFENKLFEQGTRDLSETIAKSSAFSIAGGGETLSAINKYINTDDVSYCSTGGGAFLEFMEGKTLPSISALNAKNTER